MDICCADWLRSIFYCYLLRVRFFKKIDVWILKSERIQKRILRFFTRRINPRSFGSWCAKGTEESTLEMDSSVPLTHHDPKDLELICLVKKRKIRFRILSDLRIQSSIFLKKRTLTFGNLRRWQITGTNYCFKVEQIKRKWFSFSHL